MKRSSWFLAKPLLMAGVTLLQRVDIVVEHGVRYK